jgi:hypothetical protein
MENTGDKHANGCVCDACNPGWHPISCAGGCDGMCENKNTGKPMAGGGFYCSGQADDIREPEESHPYGKGYSHSVSANCPHCGGRLVATTTFTLVDDTEKMVDDMWRQMTLGFLGRVE